MEGVIISGIQQMGIGVSNVNEAWKWYRKNFGVDIRIFEENAVAEIMLPYTGGQPRSRHAALVVNMQGGGGFEIWQYTERTPEAPAFKIQVGDLGIYAAKIKSKNVRESHSIYKADNQGISTIQKDPSGNEFFFIYDPYGNVFQVVQGDTWFINDNKHTGSAYGAMIGVTNIEKSLEVYSGILGYDKVVYDKTGHFNDLSGLPGGNNAFRRVLLQHSKPRQGAFSELLGSSQIELIQVIDRQPRKIFENRFWGDLGFIHLCYDIKGMKKLKDYCSVNGYPFTVDSLEAYKGKIFDMGEAAGHFSYIEDPDGTLIEFVETHKLPIIKKLGLYLSLKNRDPKKALPRFIVKALRFNRVKD
jgi:catechol 2,3-dioxygenase-like lactoylglutathione lyase family enzyme